jgi:hypothetical protein
VLRGEGREAARLRVPPKPELVKETKT